jgi:cellulase
MSSITSKIVLAGAFAATALAHGTVTGFVTDGTYNGGFKLDYYYAKLNGQATPATAGWYAENLDNGFVEPNSYGTADIICHKNAEAATSSATVKAGGTIDFQWSVWPESHMGPVITYIAPCNGDCAAVDKTALKFTKIAAEGYDASTKSWAAVTMIANNNTASVTVPSSIKAGNYVFRHEIIALHGAGSANGAQSYPQCMNIEITGSGTEEPAGTLGTKLYTPTDAGILFDPYSGFTSYEIPGPALFGSGTETGDGATPVESEVASAPVSSAPAATSAASTPVSSAAPTASVVATPVESAAPVATATEAPATPSATGTPSTTLPETFTLDTFIAWLKEVSVSKASKARRHARQF